MRGRDRDVEDLRVLFDGAAPDLGATPVTGALTRGHQRTHRRASPDQVPGFATAESDHHLVHEGEALIDLALAYQRQSLVGESPDLQVLVLELAGDGQGLLGPLDEVAWIMDIAADPGKGVVSALEARSQAFKVAPAPRLPHVRCGPVTGDAAQVD